MVREFKYPYIHIHQLINRSSSNIIYNSTECPILTDYRAGKYLYICLSLSIYIHISIFSHFVLNTFLSFFILNDISIHSSLSIAIKKYLNSRESVVEDDNRPIFVSEYGGECNDWLKACLNVFQSRENFEPTAYFIYKAIPGNYFLLILSFLIIIVIVIVVAMKYLTIVID